MSAERTTAEYTPSTPLATGERPFGSHLTLQKLEVFCLVADLRSVTRAAERLGIAQPAVTAHLRSLEVKLQMRLVARSGRNIELTEAGRHVLAWARDVVNRSIEMRRDLAELAGGGTGSAVLSASMAVGSYALAEIVTAFHKDHPRARITTHISNPKLATEAVHTGACDFAVLLADPEQTTQGLVVEPLWDERLLLTAAPKSKLVGKRATAAALMRLPFITPPKGLVARDLEDALLSLHGIFRRNVILEFSHPEAVKRATRADAGVGFQWETTVLEDLRRGTLREVPISGVALRQPTFLVYRRRKTFTPLQRRLLEFIRAAEPRGARRARPA